MLKTLIFQIIHITFPANQNTNVDLTINYLLSKNDVSQPNIQNLLSFGSEELGTVDPLLRY